MAVILDESIVLATTLVAHFHDVLADVDMNGHSARDGLDTAVWVRANILHVASCGLPHSKSV